MSELASQKDFLATRNEYDKKLQGRRRWFWRRFSLGIAGIVLLVLIIRYLVGGPKFDNDQILKGAPQFIVLSLVVILAAYLRQVSAGAVEQRIKVLGGEVWNYPSDRGYGYVARKLRALDKTVYALSLAAPFLISLAIVAAGRIMLDGASKFGALQGIVPWLLYYVDLAIAIWLVILFSVLARVHWLARAEDESIQLEARKKEPEILEERRKRSETNQGPPRETRDPGTAGPFGRGAVIRAGTAFLILAIFLWCTARTEKK